ncbi:unnamed protein product [Rhizopus microsporus]
MEKGHDQQIDQISPVIEKSNLFSFNTKFRMKFTVAMDFIGNFGYLELLRLVDLSLDDYIIVAHLVTDLVIPTTIETLCTVKDTLVSLVTLKLIFYSTKEKMLQTGMDCANFSHRIILSALLGKSDQNSINLNMLLFWTTFIQRHRPVHPTPSHHLYFLHQGTTMYRNASF